MNSGKDKAMHKCHRIMLRKCRRYLSVGITTITCALVLLLIFGGGNDPTTHHVKKLSQYQHPVEEGPRKVILLSYMRSGSTFLGEFSQQNNRHLYFFEPVDGLYSAMYGTTPGWYPLDIIYLTNGSARILPEFEQDFLTQNLIRMLNCDFDEVPVETLDSYDIFGRNKKSMNIFQKCLQNIKANTQNALTDLTVNNTESADRDQCKDDPINKIYCCKKPIKEFCRPHFWVKHDKLNSCNKIIEGKATFRIRHDIMEQFEVHKKCVQRYKINVKHCLPLLSEKCFASEARVIKTIRLRMETVEQLLQIDPHIQIVHLVRDPRGIINSRVKGSMLSGVAKSLSKDSPDLVDVEEARLLCHQMLLDINKREQLEHAYPHNFHVVSYEKMSQDPVAAYHQLYTSLGLPVSDTVFTWLKQATAADTDGQQFGTYRKNSMETSMHWKKEMTVWKAKAIGDVCSEVLDYMSRL